MNYKDVLQIIKDSKKECGNNEFIVNGVKKRLFVSMQSNQICEFDKGCRRYGHIVLESTINNWTSVVPLITQNGIREKQYKTLKKVIEILDKSGLWVELNNGFKKLYSLGFDVFCQYCTLDYNGRSNFEKENNCLISMDSLPQTLKRGIKTIVFESKTRKEIVSDALNNKRQICETWRKSYDNSFYYYPEKGVAYYNEEYKGCANGHYYLAIDASHAIFAEDD